VAVSFVYLGLIACAIGLLSIIRPMRWLGIGTRRRAAYVLAAGVVVTIVGAEFPAPVVAAPTRVSMLDGFIPRYQFNEVHSIQVHAPPEAVFAAIKQVTAREIRLFRLLTWMRSPRIRSRRENILAAPPDKPILDVATHSGFLLLGEAAPRELVIGTVGIGPPLRIAHPTPQDFQNLTRPGYAKIAMNFAVEPTSNGWSTLKTETRIFATNETARRRFGEYWRLIYPGSSLIRVMWLRAIRTRAER
jgi:hypothetical protein